MFIRFNLLIFLSTFFAIVFHPQLDLTNVPAEVKFPIRSEIPSGFDTSSFNPILHFIPLNRDQAIEFCEADEFCFDVFSQAQKKRSQKDSDLMEDAIKNASLFADDYESIKNRISDTDIFGDLLPQGSFSINDEISCFLNIETNVQLLAKGDLDRKRNPFLRAPRDQLKFHSTDVFDDPTAGRTPKFKCAAGSGRVLKIKFGIENEETYSEVAATTLMKLLGFPADHMMIVKNVKCFGCIEDPFSQTKNIASGEIFARDIRYGSPLDFNHVVIEEKVSGIEIKPNDGPKGWSFKEDLPKMLNSTRTERGMLVLMAGFLQHWDSKRVNNRIVCSKGINEGECVSPLAFIQDLGGSFGRSLDPNVVRSRKLFLTKWMGMSDRELLGWIGKSRTERRIPIPGHDTIFSTTQFCKVEIQQRVDDYGHSANISEDARIKLLGLLDEISEDQIYDIFELARFDDYPRNAPKGYESEWHGENILHAWTDAFLYKVNEIRNQTCPS